MVFILYTIAKLAELLSNNAQQFQNLADEDDRLTNLKISQIS